MKSPIKSTSPARCGRLPGTTPEPAAPRHVSDIPRLIRALGALLLVLPGACGSDGARPPRTAAGSPSPPSSAAPTAEQSQPEAQGGVRWAEQTRSPRAATADQRGVLAEACGEGDAALGSLAQYLAERDAEGAGEFDMGEVNFRLRALGSPYVWPRIYKLAEATLEPAQVAARLKDWVEGWPTEGKRRCGVATVQDAGGTRHLIAVAADVLADLEPVPTRVRPSQWVEVRAKVHVPLSEAKLVVLGPRGAPHTVPTTTRDGVVSARFSADRPGTWKVQVLGTLRSGPRPIAEAVLAAGRAPPGEFRGQPVPGEAAGSSAKDAPSAIERMVNAARHAEGLPPLRRDARLDELARAHADAMLEQGRIAHDVGDGNPQQRIEAAGIAVRAAGENVAHAANPQRAHRALWDSPSHRGNLLLGRFDSVGIGVVKGADGTVWVCEMFADLP